MGISRSDLDAAQYPSYQEFLAFSKEMGNHPSFTNLFSVHFATPKILQNNAGVNIGSKSRNLLAETGDLAKNLNFYANAVNLPSKQVTSAAVTNVGSAYKYATNVAYSQANMTFIMPRSQQTRMFFERWVSRMAPDSNQYVDFYENYTCPSIRIYKWERGGGQYVYEDSKMVRALRDAGDPFLLARKFDLTAVWELRNAFPYNIGSIQLNNDSSRAMTLTIGFSYERYRMRTKADYEDSGQFRFDPVGSEGNFGFQRPRISSQGV